VIAILPNLKFWQLPVKRIILPPTREDAQNGLRMVSMSRWPDRWNVLSTVAAFVNPIRLVAFPMAPRTELHSPGDGVPE
jgi:hypothetical protein